ncbi:TonB-dependent receptor [Caulobacter hibisci]|uniref:TonB-dependent receptor n=1 Tax=Caulobacter hibisci TaxID=2035993 RepID=A0ABS0T5Y8_9CAUL|nr:TonB-dependent receptor [Caulobacter hibisci]MBI1686287.1 TonB-dependent receptor [Caulobacter hibisci]
MKSMWKAALLAGAAWGASCNLAMAQEQPVAEPEVGVEAVVVTARRREETLKDVPVAVSALSAARLEATGASDITTLQQQTPNATVQIARGSNSTLISFIRGVGQQDPLWGFEPGVGLYVDDVYIARPQGAVLDIFDIERIEVLRGPQGTLYGRNTIGGAIKYVTSKLDLDKPEFLLRGSVGSYDQRDVLLQASIPFTDKFAIGGAVASYDRGGFGENLTTGQDHYDKDVAAYRASAEFTPRDDLFFRFAYDRVNDNSSPRHGHRETAGSTADSAVLSDVYDTRAGLSGPNRVDTEGWSFTGSWEASDKLTFKSISAYRESQTDTIIDFDGTPAPTLDIPAYYADEQFSQEFQAQFTTDRIQGVVGVYYMNGYAKGAFDTIAGNLGLSISSAGKVATTSKAIFGDVSFDVNDRLKVSVGGRWTQDDKNANVFRAFYLGATRSPTLGGTPRPIFATRTNYVAADSFEKFTPRVSVSYDLNDDLTGYASFSSGFKSGGWDMRGDAALVPQTANGYQPETVDTYEAGLKGNLFDRRLFFSSAVFYSDYKDQQITTQQVATAPAVGIASVVDNAGASTIYGAEFEGSAFFSPNLSANFALGYLHAEFDEFITLVTGTPVDISNTRQFQNAPKFSGYLGVTWRGDVAGGTLRVTPSVSYRGDYHLFDVADPILDQDAYALVDLGVVWDAPGKQWQVAVYGKNLTDEQYRVGGYSFPGATYNNSIIGFYGPPRTWTASVQYKF